MRSADPTISIRGMREVHKHYEHGLAELTVIENLSLDLPAGKITVLLGPSGCGKTTILNLLAGIEPVSSGEITTSPSLSPRVGYVFQRDRLLPWRTALENTLLGSEIAGHSPRAGKTRAFDLIARLGLSGFENSYPDALSEGMRQRVSLCRALLVNPQLLLLDEPLSALDLEARLAAEDLIRTFTREHASATVLVTHDLDEAIAIADELILLSRRPAKIRRSWHLSFKKDGDDGRSIRRGPEFQGFVADLTNYILQTHESQ